jgi:hypothetical protein
MPRDVSSHRNDRKILIEILIEIESGLYNIVSVEVTIRPVRHGRFRKEFAQLIPGPWEEVSSAFRQARKQLETDQLDWQYVEGIGLTGDMLKWKKAMLDQTVRSGGINRFLKIANSLLGSLSGAIPVLEIAKEYKENIEAAMVHGSH